MIRNNKKLEEKLDKKARDIIVKMFEEVIDGFTSYGYYSGIFDRDTIEREMNLIITENMFDLGIRAYNKKHNLFLYLRNKLSELSYALKFIIITIIQLLIVIPALIFFPPSDATSYDFILLFIIFFTLSVLCVYLEGLK
jgi:hypothetical protein